MSHFTTVKTKLRNIDALAAALKRMGYQCQRNDSIVDYAGNKQHVDLSVVIPGQRSVGFVRSSGSDELELVGDWWRSTVTKEEFLGKIKFVYARHQVIESLQNQGIDVATVREIEQPDGSVVFEVPVESQQIQALTAGN